MGVRVVPEEVSISNRVENERVKVGKLGEVRFIEEEGGKEIWLSSFFRKK